MRRRLFGPVLLCLALAAAAAAIAADDTVVARVGTRSITQRALAEHRMRYYGKVALEQLINQAALRQEAARLKVTVSEADLAAREAEARKTIAGSLSEFLEAAGITEEIWRAGLREDLLAEKVLTRKWPVREPDLVRLSVRYARLQSQREAKQLIQEARRGVDFTLLVMQRSLDKENGGLLRDILRINHPAMYKAASEANIRVGQVTPQPIEAKGYWLVLKLEGRKEASALSPTDRKTATARILAFRMARLPDALRRQYRVQYVLPMTELIASPTKTDESVVAKVGAESIMRSDLGAHLGRFTKVALEQLIERSIVSQEAEKLGVRVSDAEVAARVAEAQKAVGKKAFQDVLTQEGVTEEAWGERVRYTIMGEKIVDAKAPPKPEELQRFSARYIRVRSRAEADAVIQALQQGAPFEQVMAQRSLDRTGDGLIKPRAFLRVDYPDLVKQMEEAKLAPGGVLPQPVQAGSFWLVIRLEARHGAETLTGKERETAVRRFRATRLNEVLDSVRKGYRVEYTAPLKSLVSGPGA